MAEQNLHTPEPGFPWLPHRRHNNYVDSIKQAGLSFCRTEWPVVSNAASAPFDKTGFFCRCADAAKEFLDNNDCTNDLFLAAYPILSLDQNDGVLADGFNSPEHMSQPWESLRGCSTFLTKGEKIKAARWFQFNRRTQDVLSTASSLLLIITYIGMLDRWFDHGLLGREKPPDDNPAAGDKNEEDGRRPEGAPGNERAVVASCAEPSRGVQLSDWDTQQQRASKKNTLADILSCRSTRAMTVVIVDVSLPLDIEAGKTCRYMESPDGVFLGTRRWRQLADYTLCMRAWMRHTANSWRNAWVCVTKLWNVCLCQRPQSRPWRMRLATSCA